MMLSFCVDADEAGQRADAIISAHSGRTRASVKNDIDSGLVTIGGVVCPKSGCRLKKGDVVSYDVQDDSGESGIPLPQDGIAWTAVYSDRHIYVINKPSGLVVHPGAGNPNGTLVNGILRTDPDIAKVGEPDRPGIVHRLDAETSGLMIVARTQEAYEALTPMFARHLVSREYAAICLAPNIQDAGRFDTPYGRHPTQRVKYTSRCESPKRAITNYAVEDRNARGYALIKCLLETGRTHQIRVHLSEHGAPILGDRLYAPAKVASDKAIARLALHARRISFDHPISGEPMTFESTYPGDFAQALLKLNLSPAT